jgi:TonB family protein
MKKTLIAFAFCLLVFSADIAQTTTPNQSPEVLQSNELNSTVMRLYGEGKYDEALPLAKRALELREKVVGRSDESLIPLLINLGEICRARKKPGDARAYLQRSLEIGKKVFGAEDIRITRALDRLAFAAYEQRDEKEGQSLLARSLAIKEKSLGPNHPDVARTAFDLGEMYRLERDYPNAQPLYEKAIQIGEKSGGKDNPELLKALQSYVAVLFAQDKTDEGGRVQKRISELVGDSGPLGGVIQAGVMNGRAIKLVQPIYPRAARADHASGQVSVLVLINEAGKVIEAKAMNARYLHPSLVAAAEDAARHSLFTPTQLSGKPVKVNGTIVYNFVRQ